MPNRARGKTVAEALHSEPPLELVALAEAWLPDASRIILDAIWNGYDRLAGDAKVQRALGEATDDLERGITQLLELAIREGLGGDEPFDVQHEVPEGESRKNPPARPRAYDIAFIHFGNVRIIWPLETKVMPPDRPLKEYVNTLNERYLTCEYAPFVSEAAMAGYVLGGTADHAFTEVAGALGITLGPTPGLTSRPHRVSVHERKVPEGKPYPISFRFHHLMMEFART